MSYEADYVVVGAGAAGAVLAARLAEDGKRTVILVEAGRKVLSAFDDRLSSRARAQARGALAGSAGPLVSSIAV